MSTALMETLSKRDSEIVAIATAINDKEGAYLKAVEDGKTDKYLQALKESLVDLRTKEGKLIRSSTVVTNSNSPSPPPPPKVSSHIVNMSLCHYVDRFPNSYVVSLSKCVLSVELTLFEGLSSQSFTFRPPPLGLLSERVVL
jgi:hypothetical protein